MEKEKLYLQAVIMDKSLGIAAASKQARKLMEKQKMPKVRETEDSYRFKNLPKTYFKPDSFRSKKISDTVTLVFGHLKAEHLPQEWFSKLVV